MQNPLSCIVLLKTCNMQPHIKNDLLYLLRILEASQKLRLYAEGFKNYEDFYYSNDQLEFNACLNQMAQIGEQAKRISDTLIDKHRNVPWPQIKGFRNRVIHEYIGIDTENVFRIIRIDVPKFHDQVILIISEELQNGTFENEEFEIAKTSPYLKHVDFSLF